jgi:broad specificity phosphatase PhoE
MKPATTTTSSSSKTIYLVRHAQSEQNVTTHRLQRGDILAVGSLVSLGYDAPVSKEGQEQLGAARERLASLVRDKGIALVAHSHPASSPNAATRARAIRPRPGSAR